VHVYSGPSRSLTPPRLLVLFLVVFLDLIGFGMIIPVFPFYAESVGVADSAVILYLGLYSVGQLIGAPLWGALSDRIGRRPVLVITLLANAGAGALLAWADTGIALAVLRVAAGICAGNISTAYAYVTDITTDATRPRALGILGSAFGLGFIIGPAFGALLVGSGTPDRAALARVAEGAAVTSLLAALLTVIRLRESLPPALRNHHTPVLSFLPSKAYWTRPVLGDLLLATLTLASAVALMQSTLAPWAARTLRVDAAALGWVYTFVGVISVIVQAWLIGPLIRRFGAESTAKLGSVFAGVGMLGIVAVPTLSWLFLPLGTFGIGSALVNPSMSALVSGTAASHERGAVMGAFQGAGSLGRVFGPILASLVAQYVSIGWPFVLGAVVMVLSLWMLARVRTTPAP
jgi:MFS transporter, DHA1 family, tetracycline resistance protein